MGNQAENLGIIQLAKETWPILPYLAYMGVDLKLTGRGRWRSGLCPWHDDSRPSLWLDTVRNLWGCHACGQHGDVLNFHALRLGGVTPGEAAKDLLRYDISFQVEGVKHV